MIRVLLKNRFVTLVVNTRPVSKASLPPPESTKKIKPQVREYGMFGLE